MKRTRPYVGCIALLVLSALSTASGQTAIQFNGTNQYVTMGTASGLGTATFTLECWFKRTSAASAGLATTTGGNGFSGTLVPLVSKGRGEADGSNVDCNYVLGLHSTSNFLVADFEEGPGGALLGLNHPVCGNTAITDTNWHHAAATYSVANGWKLYLDGVAQTVGTACSNCQTTSPANCTTTPGATPRSDSIQHFGVGSALTSTGVADGYFNGAIDEVRVWNVERTAAEISAGKNLEITSGTGLIGRWGFNNGSGTTATASVGPNGTLTNNPTWVSGPPALGANQAPNQPTLVTPANGAAGVGTSPTLTVNVTDPESNPMTVTFFGRAMTTPAPGPDFAIIALPDTQFYACGTPCSSDNGLLNAQLQWIVDNKASRNIAFVTQLGDCVEHGNDGNGISANAEWDAANAAWSLIENPATTFLTHGIPFGIAVGNHDQTPINSPRNGTDEGGTTTRYNNTFGVSRFSGRSYYGGRYDFGAPATYPNNNDNHYELFSASGLDFIIIHLEFESSASATRTAVLAWANGLLQTYSNRRAIITSHYLINPDGSFGDQGQATYDALKANPNLFLMLCGHLDQANRRTDVFSGNTVYTLLSDYQTRPNGGRGWMRRLLFSPANNTIHVETFSPWANYPTLPKQEQLINSHADNTAGTAQNDFTLSYAMGSSPPPFVQIGSPQTGVASGSNASVVWSGLNPNLTHEWKVTVSDGTSTTNGPTWNFQTQCTGDAACDDGNPCTTDVCSSGTCTHTNNTNSCNDGNNCTTGDVCTNGACVGTPVSCSGGTTCNPANGLCEAQPVTVTFQQGVSGYSGTVDTYLNIGEASTSKATAPTLIVDLVGAVGSPLGVNQALLRFDNIFGTGTGQIPPGSTIQSATLTLFVSNENVSAPGAMYRMVQSWSDGNTWSTFGGNGIQADDVEAWSTPDVTSVALAAGLQSLTVTSSLITWNASPSSNRGWAILPSATVDNGLGFDSAEGTTVANRPKLSVTYIPPPACQTNANCDDGNACTTDTCNNGTCVYTPITCNDSNACTTDTCNPASGCVYTPITCNDNDGCTTDTCNPASGCVYTPVDCNDNDPCTTDSCQPANSAAVSMAVGQYVNLGTGAAVTNFGTGSFTFEGWFKAAATSASNMSLFRMGRSGNFPVATIQIVANTTTIQASVESNVSPSQADSAAVAFTLNTWTHFAVVADRTISGDQRLKLYVNGALASDVSAPNWSTNAISSSDATVLGANRDSAGTPAGTYNGAIDEVRIWNTARTQAEIQANMNVQLLSGTGLAARWGLNEGSGTSAADSVGSNTGTLTGGATWVTGAANLVNMGSGGCVHTPIANCCTSAAQCDDSNACTTDTCDSGQCVHTAITCDDGSACTTDTCSPATGCVFTPITCNDNNGCTTDSCNPASGCVFTPLDCNDNNDCTTDSCAPANTAAISFDGVDDYVSVGTGTAVTNFGTGSFTVEGWFYTDGGNADRTGIIRIGRQGTAMQIVVQLTGTASPYLVVAGSVDTGQSGGQVDVNLTGGTAVSANAWHHFALVGDRSTLPGNPSGQELRLYIDGGTPIVANAAAWASNALTTADATLFGVARADTGALATYFDGRIDEVRFWNTIRTQAQIQANMNVQLTSAGGLIARWGMNEGTGGSTADSVGTNNGTLTNGAGWSTSNLVNMGTGGCVHTPIANCCSSNAQCDDSNACTTDVCNNGTCVNTPITCNDNDACTTDTCNPASGCVYTPIDCNDGDSCTVDTCVNGVCQHVVNCDDGNPCTVDSCAPGNSWALTFDGTDDYVTMGAAPTLNTSTFTIECWFKRTGTGIANTTGTNGIPSLVPLVAKYGPEGDGTGPADYNINGNYVFGIDTSTNTLAGDFEELTGPNHPATSPVGAGNANVIANGSWYHAAATYDGTSWRIYLNGSLIHTEAENATPIGISIQHFSLGTMSSSLGTTRYGRFQGVLDEVRVWNYARSGAQISGAMNSQITSDTGLIGRWGLNDGSPSTTAADSSGNANAGTLTNGPVWVNSGLPNLGGGCVHTPVANGTGCSDGNLCNGSETCQAGICTSGTPLDCNDNNPCTNDSCDSQSGCQHVNNTAACDDGNACTTGDVCSGGSCAGTPLDCDDNNPCTTDSCNNGTCVHTNNSASCDDGDACTINDTCSGGGCAGTPMNCDDGNPCTTDSCSGGVCQHVNNSNVCDDGNACTTGDTCSGGVCTGSPIVCNDNNPCTDDSCVNGNCIFTPNSNTCNDGNACTNNDVCSNGVCAGSPIQGCCNIDGECNDNNACTTDACVNHACQNTPNTDPCNDGNPCTNGDACANGVCSGTAVQGCCTLDSQCDDGNPCTTDLCFNNVCQHVNNTAACDDGNACTDMDTCAGGSCAGTPIPGCCNNDAECADGNLCTDDACVNHVCQNSNNSNACDDGNACTTGDTCSGGLCAGAPVVCNDNNPCTDDSCVNGSCVFTPNSATCNDGNACTTGDVCVNGACQGTPLNCNDNNPCTDDSCVDGACQHVNNVASCDDGNICTSNDTCANGACAGSPVANCCTSAAQCDDGNPCTTDTCENNQCVHTPNSNSCDDGNACTSGDTCSNGACVGTPVSCSDGNPCTIDSCDSQLGCQHTNATDGTSCSDGQYCNGAETCLGGICTDGLDPCVDVLHCNEAADTCYECVSAAECNDNNPCTADSCSGGSCVHTPLNCINVTLHVDGIGHAVTRDVTFVLTPCGGVAEMRVLPVAFTASGSGYGIGTVLLSNVNANTAWLSAREGHTLKRRLPVSFPPSLSASVDFTGSNKLLAGDLQTAGSGQDNLVDVIDFAILAARWNTVVGDCQSGLPAECSRGADVNGDGQQGTIDFTALQINFFKTGDSDDGCPPGLQSTRPIGVTGPLQSAGRMRVRVSEVASRVANAAQVDLNADGTIDAADIRIFAARNRLTLLPSFEQKLGAAQATPDRP